MRNFHQIIQLLNLLPHPEGGYYRRNWQSDMRAETLDASSKKIHNVRSVGSSIIYLLPSEEVSTWHRITCDEMWHFYDGSPLKLYMLDMNQGLITRILGINLEAEQLPQIIIPRNTWFCAEVAEDDSYSLCGCTLWPSFSYADFDLADRQKLVTDFPEHMALIDHIYEKTNGI
ncbi:MAG: cupin domain-containing protein [Candidatus Cloacimonetes bacterium]|jgi:hypothetical protein|nr:cupin domain-containing protein [Candidatus Cloacimonadota bacterium]MDD2507088.1 cupin domain-containing protein [Candidatus Cloacimonadota bacterium]MDD4560540.1 cupin domain-containing protein [Candidatus Cloacimonadota bacterium]